MTEIPRPSDTPEKSREEVENEIAEIFGHAGTKWKAPPEEEFSSFVSHCLVEGIPTIDIADMFGVSIRTVERWSLKISVPIFFARKSIMDRLQQLLDKKNERTNIQ